MNFSPATITEYYVLQAEKRGEIIGMKRGEKIGVKRGEIIGRKRGEAIGYLKGSIQVFDDSLAEGLISQEFHRQKVEPLKIELAKLLASSLNEQARP